MKKLLLIIPLLLLSGWDSGKEIEFIGFDSAYIRLQIKNDYYLMKNLIKLFPNKGKPQLIFEQCFKDPCGDAFKVDENLFRVYSQDNRGHWFHEMGHAFVHQIPEDSKTNIGVSQREEFLLELGEHFINGYTPEMVKHEVVR